MRYRTLNSLSNGSMWMSLALSAIAVISRWFSSSTTLLSLIASASVVRSMLALERPAAAFTAVESCSARILRPASAIDLPP